MSGSGLIPRAPAWAACAVEIAAIEDAETRKREERIAFHGRCLELARHNGFAIELEDGARMGVEGQWWLVPAPLVEVVGCMSARVA